MKPCITVGSFDGKDVLLAKYQSTEGTVTKQIKDLSEGERDFMLNSVSKSEQKIIHDNTPKPPTYDETPVKSASEAWHRVDPNVSTIGTHLSANEAWARASAEQVS